jgi:hypothetical protein
MQYPAYNPGYPPMPPQRKRSPWLIIVLLIGLAFVLVAGYFFSSRPNIHPMGT